MRRPNVKPRRRNRGVLVTLFVLLVGLLAWSPAPTTPVAGADDDRQPQSTHAQGTCEHPHPCDYRWEGADGGPYDLAEVREVTVESHDGVTLHGWIGLPDLPADVAGAPVALHSSPYLGVCRPPPHGCPAGPDDPAFWSQDPPWTMQWGVAPIELIERGYAAAFFDVRGAGRSGGCRDHLSPAETLDQAVLVDWLADRSWSNGRVAMGGVSFPGITPWQAAINVPEGLKAIVTAGIVTDAYTFFHTPQGANMFFEGPFTGLVNSAIAAPHLGNGPEGVQDATHLSERLCPSLVSMFTEPTLGAERDVRDGAYWEPRRFVDRVGDVESAVLLVHGLQDARGHAWQESLVWQKAVKAPVWQIAGQWGHGPPFSEEPALTPSWIRDNWERILFDWLDYWLMGIGPVPPERVDLQDGDGDWHTNGAWPPPRSRDEVLYLSGNSVRPDPAAGDQTFVAAPHLANTYESPPLGVPSYWWSSVCRENVHDALGELGVSYLSEPLDDDAIIAGNPFAYLRIRSTQPGGHVGVSVGRLPPDASCSDPDDDLDWLTSGAADLRYHQGGYTARDFPVDEPVQVRVDLIDLAEPVHAGDRLVVILHGGEDPILGAWSSPPRHTPRITVEAGASPTATHVVLPVFEGTFGGARPTRDYPPRPFS